MKTLEHRINNIIGQLEGVKKMTVQPQIACGQVLIQLKAVKSAVNSLSEKIISQEIDRCLGPDFKSSQRQDINNILKEIVKK